MDQRTLNYYDAHAPEVAARYRSVDQSVWQQRFREVFPAKARVLDVGSGSGRDLALLLSLGFDAHGLEPSPGMRAEAFKAFPELSFRIFPHGLPVPEDADTGGKFDGIVCSAVLMHVPEAELFDAAFSLKRLLRNGGRLLVSVPAARPGLDQEHRDGGGRLFKSLYPEYLSLLFERLGFDLKQQWTDSDRLGRDGIEWVTLLFELNSGHGRPLDNIERVMNRDQKSATYKLALLRALSDIATLHYHQAEWVSESSVALPMDLIAEKWFRYYWPIFESAEFIPQNNGEKPGSARPVAFRKPESQIVEIYRERGGLAQFLADEAAGSLGSQIVSQYRATLRRIGDTIKDGPVVYASGNMFQYDAKRRAVIVSAKAWREFCQLGHWIEPAVVLRWAEETHRMSNQQVETGKILNLLVTDPTAERDVAAAKAVFDQLEQKECVWSEKPLKRVYAVDHVIPFSLWHCNELWNLMPCDAGVNLRKSDRLPERGLLFKRKDRIVDYWERMRMNYERRFDRELMKFTGQGGMGVDWQNAAFRNLVESVEVTAAQRGSERWRP